MFCTQYECGGPSSPHLSSLSLYRIPMRRDHRGGTAGFLGHSFSLFLTMPVQETRPGRDPKLFMTN